MANIFTGSVYYLSSIATPFLEVKEPGGSIQSIPFQRIDLAGPPGQSWWLARPGLLARESWLFRIKQGDGAYLTPAGSDFFQTRLRTLWLQDGQIFDYQPAPSVSPSQVIKIAKFTGSLPPRALYLYLPRGYKEHTGRAYPLLYMHDGQNCFEAFAADSFAGSWRADLIADALIGQGRMRETLIVGVSNGQKRRINEYLPPYVTHQPPAPSAVWKARQKGYRLRSQPVIGQADQTAAYYRYEVDEYLRRNYRVLAGRDQRATCGSSLGGLFSLYLAWERTEFARHHAVMSPSLWITRTPQGTLEAVERLRTGERRDIRLWLDSGTLDAPGRGDDGLKDTQAARAALIENGYRENGDFRYYLAEGATHSEAAWAERLPQVFEFLFPMREETGD